MLIEKGLIVDAEEFRTVGKMVPENAHGQRIDAYLGQNFPFHPRSEWKQKLKVGHAIVNGKSIKPTYKVQFRDRITTWYPEEMEPEVPTDIREIWGAKGIKAVFKPSGLPMHEVGKFRKNTLSNLLIEKFGPDWSAVHRLDTETSGIVLCGNEHESRSQLAVDFSNKQIHKEYLAIVLGQPKQNEWTVDAPIGDALDTKLRKKKSIVPSGEQAITDFRVIKSLSQHSLVKAFPKTGRTHQIRIHAAHSGYRLLGEKKHIGDETVFMEFCDRGLTPRVLEAAGCARLCLHSYRIKFFHPILKEFTTITCPMDAQMQAVWDNLEKAVPS